jgi:hypothetical protein
MSDDGKDDKKKDEEEELDCSHPEVVNKYQQAGAVANGKLAAKYLRSNFRHKHIDMGSQCFPCGSPVYASRFHESRVARNIFDLLSHSAISLYPMH